MPDTAAEKKVVVRIFGEEYPITGVSDPANISRIADIVDSRMREAARVSRSQARDKVASSTDGSHQARIQALLDKIESALAD